LRLGYQRPLKLVVLRIDGHTLRAVVVTDAVLLVACCSLCITLSSRTVGLVLAVAVTTTDEVVCTYPAVLCCLTLTVTSGDV
jgi:hypothetical protein